MQLHPPRAEPGDGYSPERTARSSRDREYDHEMRRNSESDWGFFKEEDEDRHKDSLFGRDSATWKNEESKGHGPSSAGMFESYVQSELDRMKPSPSVGGGEMPSNFSSNFYDSMPEGERSRSHHQSPHFERDKLPPLHIDSPSSPSFTSSSRPNRPSYEEDNTESSQAQRQHIIASLRKHQQRGYPLSIEITGDTPLHVLRTELDLIEESQNSITMVNNMRNGMNMFMRVCEFGNKKVGEPVPLSGWTDNTFNENPNLYDHSLERIYNMYWRNSYAHPISELGMTILLSAGGYAIQGWLSPHSRNSEFNNHGQNTNTHGPAPPPFRPSPGTGNFGSGGMGPTGPSPGTGNLGASSGRTWGPSNYATTDGGKAIGGGGPRTDFGSRFDPQQATGSGAARPSFRPPFTSQSRSEPVSTIPTH